MAIFNIIAMTAFLAYLIYIFARTIIMKETREQVKENFRFVYKMHRLKRGKAIKMVYLIWFLGRRMVLALMFVFLNNQDYAPVQVLIWLMSSLTMMFIIVKIRPFGDLVMNYVQFINELFIFVAGLIMLPLANILRDLDSRDNAGGVLLVVLIMCIAFNIIVLLLRTCVFAYDYIVHKLEKEEKVR